MGLNSMVFLNGVLFGLGLAADAFLISLSNGLNSPKTKRMKIIAAALIFALFQFIAPMAGWLCVHTVAKKFAALEKCLCWIAFIVLCCMGVKMIIDGIRTKDIKAGAATLPALLAQAALTSVDALSVGFAVSELNILSALITSVIIAAVTFAVYIAGFCIGRRFGTRFANKATVTGGLILIVIGVEVLLGSLL